MLKDLSAVIGIGLGGQTVGYGFQQKNYASYLINGSEQDNKTLPDAKNVMVLTGYDGMAGDRSLALEALRKNRDILKKLSDIDQKIIFVIASGGGSTGSGCITYVCDILSSNPDKIVVAVLLMPRSDEPIQKRLNAYNTAKELMEIEELGAIIFVNNEANDDLKKINGALVNMLDAFLTDSSSSTGANFDDSEKMRMLKDRGSFVIAVRADKKAECGKVTTMDMVTAVTAKNVFLPINNDGVVGNIGIINQRNNKIDEHELIKAIGTPENVFTGYNGNMNIVCVSGLSFPTEYISKLGKSALAEQKDRLSKRSKQHLLEDLDTEDLVTPEPVKKTGKRRKITLDFLNELDN